LPVIKKVPASKKRQYLKGLNMKCELKYGDRKIEFDIPDKNYAGTLSENLPREHADEKHLISRAMAEPLGTAPLHELVHEGETAAIVTSDITRPTPSAKLLPFIIRELKEGGIHEKDITIITALGTHRKHTERERKLIAGSEIYNKVKAGSLKMIDSDPYDCTELGICRHGTPLDVFRPVAASNRIICLGTIEYHYHAGYSGGCKTIMPGVSSMRAIRANHSHLFDAGAAMGHLDGNPVREDIDEAGKRTGIDFILNVIQDDDHNIAAAVAGDCIKAHRRGCELLDDMKKVKLDHVADITVVSSGGHPRDMNLYQAHKALESVKNTVRPGGTIIWCARAAEGMGNAVFAEWLKKMTFIQMKEKLQHEFVLGGHLAYFIAEILENKDIYLVSDLCCGKPGTRSAISDNLCIYQFASVQEALDSALKKTGDPARVLVVPSGNSLFPYM